MRRETSGMSKLSVCWTAVISAVTTIALLMLILRCIVGFQDDIVTRVASVVKMCLVPGLNETLPHQSGACSS